MKIIPGSRGFFAGCVPAPPGKVFAEWLASIHRGVRAPRAGENESAYRNYGTICITAGAAKDQGDGRAAAAARAHPTGAGAPRGRKA